MKDNENNEERPLTNIQDYCEHPTFTEKFLSSKILMEDPNRIQFIKNIRNVDENKFSECVELIVLQVQFLPRTRRTVPRKWPSSMRSTG